MTRRKKSLREKILENYTKDKLDCKKLVSLIETDLKTVSYSQIKKSKSTDKVIL